MTRRMRTGILAALLVLPTAGLSAQEWRGGRVRADGVVKNEKGEPIEGCKVTMRWGRGDHGGPDLVSDKSGRWAIFGLASGPWDVDFDAPGYEPKKISVEFQSAGRNPTIEIQLEPRAAAAAAPAAAEQAILVGGKKVSKETAEAIEAGNAAMSAKNWPLARQSYVEALAELPDNSALLQRVAATYLAEGNAGEAVRYARMAVEKDPQDFAAWRMIAELELQRGNLEAGVAALEKVPPEKITNAQPYLNVGILLLNGKKPAEAEAAFDKAIGVEPAGSEGYYYRGLARLQQKKNGPAKADLQKALELAPDGPDAKDIKDILKSLS